MRGEYRFPQASPRADHRQPNHTIVGLPDELWYSTAFTAALAVALGEGRDLREAASFANAARALATTRLGAQPSMPPRAEVEALLAASSKRGLGTTPP